MPNSSSKRNGLPTSNKESPRNGKKESIKSLRKSGLGASQPRFVVVGNGQSSAEIFRYLWTRFSDSEVSMIIKGAALRPSDHLSMRSSIPSE